MTVQITPRGFFSDGTFFRYYPRRIGFSALPIGGHFTRTPEVEGNRKTFILNLWLKIAEISEKVIFSAHQDTLNYTLFGIDSAHKFYFIVVSAGTTVGKYEATSQVQRDPTQYGNVILAIDTTAVDKIRIYHSGKLIALTTTGAMPDSLDTHINDTVPHYIGYDPVLTTELLNSNISEFMLLDGQQSADPRALFTEFNAYGAVVPKQSLSGLTYGTNGFYLNFAQV